MPSQTKSANSVRQSRGAMSRPAVVSTLHDADPGIERILESVRALTTAGGPLPSERALAAQLDVKRHQLRRALERLRESGEIATPPLRRGGPRSGIGRDEALVRSTNPVEVIELRIMLEPALARLAALRATPFDITRLERAATTPAGMDGGTADLVFHKLLAASARNGLAEEFYALLRKVGTDARLRVGVSNPGCPQRLQQRDAEHRAVVAAIAARDPDGAERAMREHLAAVQRRVLEGMSPGASAA
ncbi:MAG: lldR 3 [Rhodospirillales bacterium]|jgi:GntR family transcriptional repressor for pyruvate dehydrogenase complex|nr:lldR 3 [Rhodospirillales bacterium]